MKRFIALACAAALALGSTVSALAADAPESTFASMPSYSTTDSARSLRHSTAALYGRSSVELLFSGNSMTVRRRAFKLYAKPDRVTITQGGVTRLEQEMNWSSLGGGIYGYDGAVSLASLGDGTYTVAVKTVDNGFITTMDETSFVKSGGVPYFPKSNSTSKQYNFGALQSLYSGNAPDDFSVLKELYSTGSDRDTLAAIEQKALELTQGMTSDRDKVLAIDWWISQNIAYDLDLPTDQYDSWVAAYPADKVRLDNPLNAFNQKYAFCYGFARLNVLMLGYAGVQSVYIRGRLAETTGNVNYELGNAIQNDEMNHAWNAVKVDGSWYFLDSSRNVVKQYHRTVPDQPHTGYTESKNVPAYLHVFSDLDFLSQTHIAMRMGVKNYGAKISPMTVPEGWQNNGANYYTEGGQLRSQWARIDGSIYYFDTAGNAAKGWRQVEGYWRYFDENRALVTGTLNLQDGGEQRVYQLDAQGRVTADNAWVRINGADRFFVGAEMLTGWQYLDGYWRYFDDAGVMYRNDKKPLKIGDSEFQFDADGALRVQGSGWLQLGDQRIYLEESEPVNGLQRIDGQDYLFDWSGLMLTGGWQRHDDATYLIGDNGVLKTGWQYLDGSWYYIDRNRGRLTGVNTLSGKECYFDGQGRLSSGGWVNVGSGRVYYADSTVKNKVARGGTLLRGWRKVDDNLYYFDPVDGRAYTGRDARFNANNEKWYTFDQTGVATRRDA